MHTPDIGASASACLCLVCCLCPAWLAASACTMSLFVYPHAYLSDAGDGVELEISGSPSPSSSSQCSHPGTFPVAVVPTPEPGQSGCHGMRQEGLRSAPGQRHGECCACRTRAVRYRSGGQQTQSVHCAPLSVGSRDVVNSWHLPDVALESVAFAPRGGRGALGACAVEGLQARAGQYWSCA
jgi:hypothetical protein